MVHLQARREYAVLLRRLAAGRITNDDYEDRFYAVVRQHGHPRDPALWGIFGRAWGLYDDMKKHALTGMHRLPSAVRKEVARWILFLYTDQPYEWPASMSEFSAIGCIPNLLTFGFWQRFQSKAVEAAAVRQGFEREAWPFRTRARLAEAAPRTRLRSGTPAKA